MLAIEDRYCSLVSESEGSRYLELVHRYGLKDNSTLKLTILPRDRRSLRRIQKESRGWGYGSHPNLKILDIAFRTQG
jgi:hypothetical protein